MKEYKIPDFGHEKSLKAVEYFLFPQKRRYSSVKVLLSEINDVM